MKNKSFITILLTVLLSMIGANVFAKDVIFFGAKNDDGVTIYYNLINDDTELEVRRSLDYSGNIVIPEEVTYKDKTLKVTNIESHAFWQCSGLTSVVIPNSVTSIEDYAFTMSDNLTSVISLIENPFEIGGREPDSSGLSTFSVGVYDNATLYVPVGTIEKYKATAGWKDFKNIEEFDPSGIKKVASDNVDSAIVFDLNGRRLSNLQKGINIIRQSDGTTKKVIVR